MAKFLFFDGKITNIIVKDESPSGGAAVQTYVWIMGLLSQGHEVLVAADPDQNRLLKEECANIKLISIFDPKKGIRWFRWIYYRMPSLYRSLRDVRPDYLYESIPNWSTLINGSICKILKITHIVRLSSDVLLDDRFLKNHSKFHQFFLNMGLKSSSCILCQNDYQLSIVRKKFPNKKTMKIPNPFIFDGAEKTLEYNERKYIAWLGLFRYPKNLKLLYEIALHLQKEKFIIAGSNDSSIDEESEIYLDKLKTLSNVEFVGFIPRNQVPSFLSKAKFLLNTSRFEGFSNTFLEAMSVGTPIISSDNVNPDLFLSKYKLGIIYKNSLDLQSKLNNLSKENYLELSVNSFLYVKTHHDHRALAHRLFDFLENRDLGHLTETKIL